MVHRNEVSEQLKRLGVNFQFWCRPEIRELPNILFEGEQLQHVLIGRYEGGFALFCATDQRVLLVDKKPFYLTLEDIRYDMISDVQYNHRLIDATMRLGTVHKTISFTAYNHSKLRNFTSFIQQQVMFFRQQQNAGQTVLTPLPTVDFAYQPAPNPVIVSSVDTNANAVNPVTAILAASKQRVMNPYSNMPLIVRRRVSRFY